MKPETKLLTEARKLISILQAYGSIHPVKGVVYPEGTHAEVLGEARRWMDRCDREMPDILNAIRSEWVDKTEEV